MNNPEASRCLMCKNARCSASCAVRTDIPAAMRLYREGKMEEAAKMLFENNPLSAITCQVCDWNRLCYGHCILNVKKNPVHWYWIEQEISIEYLKSVHITPAAENGKNVSIIGAGPAGIVAAILLRQKGFAVTIYDEHERIGGVLRYGIPAFRLDKSHIDEYERILKEAGVRFKGRVKIGTSITLKKIRCVSDAVLIATGAAVPRSLRIPGEKPNESVISALEYLDNPDAYLLGKRVIVVGGGNVAMDASRTAVKDGHDTIILYRKNFENMPANTIEVEEALKDGVEFRVLQVPVEIKKVDGKNIAVVRDCKTVISPDGTAETIILEGTDHEIEFDDMIIAVSETVDFTIFGDDSPESHEGNKWPKVNGVQQTSFPDVFLAGDFLLGPKTVVQAVQSAKIAVQGIIEYLK